MRALGYRRDGALYRFSRVRGSMRYSLLLVTMQSECMIQFELYTTEGTLPPL